MDKPLIIEPAPEERIAKVIQGLLQLAGVSVDLLGTLMQLSATLSPYMQIEMIERAHQERVFCLADFYNLRERLMERDRLAFQRSNELNVIVLSRPEARFIAQIPILREHVKE